MKRESRWRFTGCTEAILEALEASNELRANHREGKPLSSATFGDGDVVYEELGAYDVCTMIDFVGDGV
jgi:hypothetical protein